MPNFYIAEDFPNPKCTMGVTTWFTPGIVDKLIVNADNWTNGTLPTSDLTQKSWQRSRKNHVEFNNEARSKQIWILLRKGGQGFYLRGGPFALTLNELEYIGMKRAPAFLSSKSLPPQRLKKMGARAMWSHKIRAPMRIWTGPAFRSQHFDEQPYELS